MISIILAGAVGTPTPVPAREPVPMDFAVGCRLFSHDGRQSAVSGTFAHDYGEMASVSLSGSGSDLPLPVAGTKWAVINHKEFWLSARRGGLNYSWHFELSRESGSHRGAVTVSTGDDYVAVGICEVTASEARIQ